MNRFSFFLLISISGAAQTTTTPDYFVYQIKGSATVQRGNAKPIALKQNQLLYDSEVLALNRGEEVTLANRHARYLVLNKPGTYRVSELNKLDPVPIDKLKKTYLGFLYDELAGKGGNPDTPKKQARTDVWGGIPRGDCDNLVFPVKSMKTSEDTLLFMWRKTSPSNNYSLKLYDAKAGEVATLPVKDTMLRLDLVKCLHTTTGKYAWKVVGQDADCEEDVPVAFELISKIDEAEMIRSLGGSSNRIEEGLALISRLEKALLITAAQKQFAALVRKNRNESALIKSYTWFLSKYGLEEAFRPAW